MKNGYLFRTSEIFSSQICRFLPIRHNYTSSITSLAALSSAIQYYIDSVSPSEGQKLHTHILKSGLKPNTNVSIKLLILHLRSGCLDYARRVFDQLPRPTTSSYNSMLSGYIKQGQVQESLGILQKLAFSDERPDGFTFSMILKLSTALNWLNLSKEVHSLITKMNCEVDDFLLTGLVDAYAKNGRVDYARKVYNKVLERNIMCCTALISGYMKEGLIQNAEEIFEEMKEKDVVVYNAMIEGYSKNTVSAIRSLEVYRDMQRSTFKPTVSTFISVLGACSILAAFDVGQQIHCQLVKTDSLLDVRSGSALIDTYSKCGRVEAARRVFDDMQVKNVFSWTSMIDGYGKNGNSEIALKLFHEMRQNDNVKPNYVTFLSALSACGHSGLVSKGWEIFRSMERDYSLKPRMEHCACMVDLLGRAGSLYEALEFIKQIPEKPNSDVWAALLGASRLHGNVEMADLAANELFDLTRSERPGAYLAFSNALAAVGQWDGVYEVRELMKERGVSKERGCSWVRNESSLHRIHIKRDS
ncbi:pentatricopeptide repeat-containing protein At1g28690, mitochondrial [Aristolochia californica]|uniref:pentatricopeptide repeat-containing protein At1g28690, mitochondrial n=1 Tax=Aristolochia californica TaxID=171875 RepID=UPI0035DA406C